MLELIQLIAAYLLVAALFVSFISLLFLIFWDSRHTYPIVFSDVPGEVEKVKVKYRDKPKSEYPTEHNWDDGKDYTPYILSGDLVDRSGRELVEGSLLYFEDITDSTDLEDYINKRFKFVLFKNRFDKLVVRQSLLYIRRGMDDAELKKHIFPTLPISSDDVSNTMTRIRLLEKYGSDLITVTGRAEDNNLEYFYFVKVSDVLGFF